MLGRHSFLTLEFGLRPFTHVTVQESAGVPEGDEAAAGHVPLSTEGAEGQSPAHGC